MKIMASSKKKLHTYGSIAKHLGLNNAVVASYCKKTNRIPLGIKAKLLEEAAKKVASVKIEKVAA
jgi:hypothetical protein